MEYQREKGKHLEYARPLNKHCYSVHASFIYVGSAGVAGRASACCASTRSLKCTRAACMVYYFRVLYLFIVWYQGLNPEVFYH